MPEYRVDIASSARAMCQDTRCKQDGVKIAKGELRFGTWVEPKDGHGSWKWKHWGCVSGLQMQQANELCDQNEDGELAFDFLDGYDELGDHPDVQKKIRRCVTQAHIDPEDFKGDPEYNVPGKRGIRAPARKAKKADGSASEDDAAAKTNAPAKKGKRSQKKADDSEAEDVKPAKKGKRSQKKADDSEDNAKPAKKAVKRKVEVKEEDADEDLKPAKKSKKSAKKVKAESDNEDEAEAQKPVKRTKSKVSEKGASSSKAKLSKRDASSPIPQDDGKSETRADDRVEEAEPMTAAKKKESRGKTAKSTKAEPSTGRRRSQRIST